MLDVATLAVQELPCRGSIMTAADQELRTFSSAPNEYSYGQPFPLILHRPIMMLLSNNCEGHAVIATGWELRLPRILHQDLLTTIGHQTNRPPAINIQTPHNRPLLLLTLIGRPVLPIPQNTVIVQLAILNRYRTRPFEPHCTHDHSSGIDGHVGAAPAPLTSPRRRGSSSGIS